MSDSNGTSGDPDRVALIRELQAGGAGFHAVVCRYWSLYRQARQASSDNPEELWPGPPGDLTGQAEAWARSLDLTLLPWEDVTHLRRGTLRWLREQFPPIGGNAP